MRDISISNDIIYIGADDKDIELFGDDNEEITNIDKNTEKLFTKNNESDNDNIDLF